MRQNDGLVSVIMPSYNTGRFIEESIKSVLSQTYENWELLIVDDCSVDNTDEVVSSFSDIRIKFFKNDRNMGAALSRNRAILEAKGEWIAFLDSDDLWMPEKLSKMLAFMKQNGYAFAYHNYEKIDEAGGQLGVLVSGPKIITRRKMYNYGYPGCLAFMYRADAFPLIQINDIKKNNDYAILLKLCKTEDCFLLSENLAKYRIRKRSISHDKFTRKFKSHYDLFRICDGKSAPVSLILALMNMFYGVLKKMRYEKRK